jgi:hypothetical protein
MPTTGSQILECAIAVTDELMPNAIGVSLFDLLPCVAAHLADPCAMSVRQIELTDRWLAMWAQGLPYAQQRETRGP